MSTTRAIEYQITRQILRRRSGRNRRLPVEGLIVAISALACLGVLAAFVPGFVWLLLLGAFMLTLGG